ncbi:PQQ-like beta-propeller repeat protein [Novipirellula artificiosorum]|uniref:Outer membrane biogenesis protein BamB n=1 Tax=Novipirellula artificiosorum TaxID=2528016 RepID=A0A5C6D132_9BACT|nr:PQQ-like beta-propeller repeat protein [Novipirellula artificiosorum]TWU30863.1 outer membrane biogenesis protein BamB [Novipirellula artificiosorum]
MVWEKRLPHPSLGGIAATQQVVIFGDRDFDDFQDIFHCLDADTGQSLWEVKRLAIGSLDYGNSTRSTPLIVGEHVYCQSALGLVLCIRIADGTVVWERNLADDFAPADELPWGYCASPLLAADHLIVSPGALDASVVALDRPTGEVIWKTPGALCSYGSLLAADIAGQTQIIGHDALSLCGWEAQSGRRLWSVTPETPGDFNVPTPILYKNKLLVATEGNGIRLYGFGAAGKLGSQWQARNLRLRTDMSSPVIVQGQLYCVKDFLFCLDLDEGLKEKWRLRDSSLSDYAAIVASEDRLLVVANGELLLLPADGTNQIVSRQRVFEESIPIYSHPALVGRRIFLRGETKMVCLEF